MLKATLFIECFDTKNCVKLSLQTLKNTQMRLKITKMRIVYAQHLNDKNSYKITKNANFGLYIIYKNKRVTELNKIVKVSLIIEYFNKITTIINY